MPDIPPDLLTKFKITLAEVEPFFVHGCSIQKVLPREHPEKIDKQIIINHVHKNEKITGYSSRMMA
jgi:type II secretory pathway component PulC